MSRTTTAVVVGLGGLVASALGTETSVPFIHADQVHAMRISGFGVTVAVIDSGVILTEPGLAGSIADGGVSFEWERLIPDGGADPIGLGHGTLVSLIITDSCGVAPDAKILSVRVVPTLAGGGVWIGDLENAIDYVTERRNADRTIRVMNMSIGANSNFGCPCDAEPGGQLFSWRVSRAADEGIITIAATGNFANCGGIQLPACLSECVKAAANYDADYGSITFVPPGCTDVDSQPYRVTCFSNITENCDWLLAAPGYDITVGPFWAEYGTSFAAPHCSGVAALMFSKNGCDGITARQARQIMYDTAQTYEWAYPWCALPPQPKHLNALAAVNAIPGPICAVTGDLDCDGRVSGYDLPSFEACMAGPGVAYPHTMCLCTDFPESPPDGDVDLRDLRLFQLAFDGMGSGACCHADSTCSITTIYDCLAENGAVYSGHDTTCADTDCVMDRYINVVDPLGAYAACGAGLQLADDLTLSGTGGGMLTHYELNVYGGGGGTFNVTVQLYTACPGSGGTAIAGTQHTFSNNPDGQLVELLADFDPPVYIPHSVWMVATFSKPQAGWFIAAEAEVGSTEDVFGRNDPPWVCAYYWPEGPYAGLWALIECAKVTGACCLPDHSCIERSQAECSAAGGVYQGHGTTCAQVDCNPTNGACCKPDGTCVYTTQAQCATLGGTFHAQTACSGVDCTPERYSNTTSSPYSLTGPYPYYEIADDLTLAGSGAGPLIHYDIMVGRDYGSNYNVAAALHTACPPTTGNQIAGTSYTWTNVTAGELHTLNASFPPVTISGTVWLRVQFSVSDAGWVIAGPAEIGSTQDRFAMAQPSWSCNYWFSGNPWAGLWANLTFGNGRDAPSEPVVWVESETPAALPVWVTPFVATEAESRTADGQPVQVVPEGSLAAPARRSRGTVPGQRASGTVTLYLASSLGGQTIQPGAVVDWTIRAQVSTSGNSGLALLSTDLQQDASNPAFLDIPPATTIGPQMAAFDRPAGISNPGPTGSAFGGTPVGTPGARNLAQIGGSQNTFGMPGVECGLDVAVNSGIGQSGQIVVASGSFTAPQAAGSYTFQLANAVATLLNSVPPPAPPAYWPVGGATVNVGNASFWFTVQGSCLGDMNCDAMIDFDDLNPFIDALSDPAFYHAQYPNCNILNGDANGDGLVDFNDINPFIDILSFQSGPCP